MSMLVLSAQWFENFETCFKILKLMFQIVSVLLILTVHFGSIVLLWGNEGSSFLKERVISSYLPVFPLQNNSRECHFWLHCWLITCQNVISIRHTYLHWCDIIQGDIDFSKLFSNILSNMSHFSWKSWIFTPFTWLFHSNRQIQMFDEGSKDMEVGLIWTIPFLME